MNNKRLTQADNGQSHLLLIQSGTGKEDTTARERKRWRVQAAANEGRYLAQHEWRAVA